MKENRKIMLNVVILVFALGMAFGGRVSLAGEIVAWGSNTSGQCDVPSPNAGFVAVAGGAHSMGLKADGSIEAWGNNGSGQCDVPLPNADFVAVAAGGYHSLGLKEDGSIVAWGSNYYGQCTVPSPNADFVAVAAGNYHSLVLKADGTVAAWGYNSSGQCDVSAPNADFVAIAGGYVHSLGLKEDGSIVAWGANDNGQCDVPLPNEDFTAIAAGHYHSLGLKSDGSIVAWGLNLYGVLNVPAPNEDFVAVASGLYHCLGLKADGSITAWGKTENGGGDVPAPNEDFLAVGAGSWHSLGIKKASIGTAFTYQGQLSDANSPAQGAYDFQFSLYDDINIQQGDTVNIDDLDVTDGYFTTTMNFGSDVFDGYGRWLEIAVRPGQSSDANDFVTLAPRQEITPTPYALQTRGLFVNRSGNVGIGTTSPDSKLDVEGTVKANSFNGVPWRSPAFYIVDAAYDKQFYFPTVADDSRYYAYNYRMPFNVTIEGLVVSLSDDYEAICWSNFKLYVDDTYVRGAGSAFFSADYDSQILLFYPSVNVSAGSVIMVKCGSTSGPYELTLWLYGRMNE